MRIRSKEKAVFLLGALGVEAGLLFIVFLGDLRPQIALFWLGLLVAFLSYLLCAFWVCRNPGCSLGGVLVAAIVFRLTLLGSQPSLSDDVYRYVWDGRVQLSGINPYLHPPLGTGVGTPARRILSKHQPQGRSDGIPACNPVLFSPGLFPCACSDGDEVRVGPLRVRDSAPARWNPSSAPAGRAQGADLRVESASSNRGCRQRPQRCPRGLFPDALPLRLEPRTPKRCGGGPCCGISRQIRPRPGACGLLAPNGILLVRGETALVPAVVSRPGRCRVSALCRCGGAADCGAEDLCLQVALQ